MSLSHSQNPLWDLVFTPQLPSLPPVPFYGIFPHEDHPGKVRSALKIPGEGSRIENPNFSSSWRSFLQLQHGPEPSKPLRASALFQGKGITEQPLDVLSLKFWDGAWTGPRIPTRHRFIPKNPSSPSLPSSDASLLVSPRSQNFGIKSPWQPRLESRKEGNVKSRREAQQPRICGIQEPFPNKKGHRDAPQAPGSAWSWKMDP